MLRAENISYGELAELQGLRDEIDPGDFELLEAAGVTEYEATGYGEGVPESVTFDSSTAFDAAEALNVLAHDYGMYAVKARLDEIPFRAGPGRDTLEGLDEEGRRLYAEWKGFARWTGPDEVPEWAEAVLVAIVAGSSTEAGA